MSGADLIAAERQRQIAEEGWTAEHDDEYGSAAELTRAAICYADKAANLIVPDRAGLIRPSWPWDLRYWKPTDDSVRNLVKAGALIAAEIDRLQRAGGS